MDAHGWQRRVVDSGVHSRCSAAASLSHIPVALYCAQRSAPLRGTCTVGPSVSKGTTLPWSVSARRIDSPTNGRVEQACRSAPPIDLQCAASLALLGCSLYYRLRR
jgi:hypothetical protein